jgi:SAM-dependent methyltransferase
MPALEEREKIFFDQRWKDTEIRQYHDALQIPGVSSLKEAKILICSCGSGIEPVQAANAGADVYAFDISSTAVDKALSVAQANNVTIKAEVMNFHSLEYPENFFDFIVGSAILHHVDCEKAGKQIYRCLKPNGIAFFWENSDRNPILRFARRIMFGRPGGHQKQQFFIFKRAGTTDEYPLTEEEVRILSGIFGGHMKRIYSHFIFIQLLSIFGWRNEVFRKTLKGIDSLTAKLCPAVMRYSFLQEIWLQKVEPITNANPKK